MLYMHTCICLCDHIRAFHIDFHDVCAVLGHRPLKCSVGLSRLLGSQQVLMLPRSDAVKQLWAYIKQHNLQDPNNGKIIR